MKAEQERLRSEGLEEQAQKYQSQIDHVEKKYQEQEQENRKIIKQQEVNIVTKIHKTCTFFKLKSSIWTKF